MSNRGMVDDPLRGGGAFAEQDMEDLTAHLGSLPTGRGSTDGLDLGDNSELLQGNLDRFRPLAGDDGADDLFTSYGGISGLGGLGGMDPTASNIITTTNYPTYGELAAAKPPSYEDSVMYEQAPLGMLAAATAIAGHAHGGDAAAPAVAGINGAAAGGGGGPLAANGTGSSPLHGGGAFVGGGGGGDPLSMMAAYDTAGGGPLSGRPLGPMPLEPQQPAAAAAAGAAQAAMMSGGAAGGGTRTLVGPLGGGPQPLAAAPAPPSAAHAAAATAAAQGGVAAGGGGGAGWAAAGPAAAARAAGPAGAAPLESLALPGSMEFREDDLMTLSPQVSSPVIQGLPPTPGPSRGAGGAHLQITVSEPIKREQGGLFGLKGGYVTYLVRTKGRVAGGQSRPDTAVRRRFREFVTLAEVLKEKYRGYFVPPRPEKNAVEGQRMTDAFVEERRLALERYLNKLARHPVIRASEELRLFLEADGELSDSPSWLALRPAGLGGSVLDGTARFSKQILGLDRGVTDPVQAAQPTKKATDFMRAIKETARSMQQQPNAALPADELALQRCGEEVEGLQGALTSTSRAAEKLVARLDRWSVVNGELGAALVHLRNAEEREGGALAQHTGTLKQSGTVMHDTQRLGTALVRVSRVGRKVTGRCAIELGCLHEYLGLMPAALKGLRAREKALLTADTLQADLEGRRRAISDLEAAGAKVLGGDAAKAKKVADLNGDVAVLEQSIVAARAQYDRIKGINQQEMSRLHSEFRADMHTMLLNTAAIMSACAQRDLEIWLHAAHELQATPEQLQAAKACLVGPQPSQPSAPTASQPQAQPPAQPQPSQRQQQGW